jgi:hypothetical protein
VGSAGLYVFPTGLPRVVRVRTEALDQPVVTLGQDLMLVGTNLRGPSTWLRIAGQLFRVADDQIGVDRIRFPLTSALGLRAGVTSVEVVHRLDVSQDPAIEDFRNAATSNAAPFGLLAVVTPIDATAVAGAHEVRLSVVPPPEDAQDVELLLDRVGEAGHAASKEFRQASGEVVFTVQGLSAGRWLLRLRVDGATSGLAAATPAGVYDQPAVNVP